MLFERFVRIIFASSESNGDSRLVIGKDGGMPWMGKIPSDMARFKLFTKGQSVVIGRKTWDSIPEKFRPFDKELPPDQSRQTIVITRHKDFNVDDPHVVVVHSFEEAIQKAKSRDVWVAGGAEIYELALPYADFIHQTVVSQSFDGDTFFPDYDKKRWNKMYEKYSSAGGPSTEKDKLDSAYIVFGRRW